MCLLLYYLYNKIIMTFFFEKSAKINIVAFKKIVINFFILFIFYYNWNGKFWKDGIWNVYLFRLNKKLKLNVKHIIDLKIWKIFHWFLFEIKMLIWAKIPKKSSRMIRVLILLIYFIYLKHFIYKKC